MKGETSSSYSNKSSYLCLALWHSLQYLVNKTLECVLCECCIKTMTQIIFSFASFHQSGHVRKDANGCQRSVQSTCLHSSHSWDQNYIKTRSREASLCQHPMFSHQRHSCRIPNPPHGCKLSDRFHHWWRAAQAGPPVVWKHSREEFRVRGRGQLHPEHCTKVCGLRHSPVFAYL